MDPRAGAPEALLRERAYLALLLLVGGGAVAVGVYQVNRSGAGSLSAFFDLALGICVLLVTWLFLAPSAWPALFGVPGASAEPVRRPYLGPAPSPIVTADRTARSAIPPARHPAIPKWADPLVQPRAATPVRSVTAPAGRTVAPAVVAPPIERVPRTPRPRPPIVPTEDELPVAVPDDPEDFRGVPWEPDPSGARPAHSREVLEELDRIEAELRAFVPPVSPRAAAPIEGLEDLVG